MFAAENETALSIEPCALPTGHVEELFKDMRGECARIRDTIYKKDTTFAELDAIDRSAIEDILVKTVTTTVVCDGSLVE